MCMDRWLNVFLKACCCTWEFPRYRISLIGSHLRKFSERQKGIIKAVYSALFWMAIVEKLICTEHIVQ